MSSRSRISSRDCQAPGRWIRGRSSSRRALRCLTRIVVRLCDVKVDNDAPAERGTFPVTLTEQRVPMKPKAASFFEMALELTVAREATPKNMTTRMTRSETYG